MPIITMSREMGSGGDDIARLIAEKLGLRLIGREIINQAACRAGVPEVALAEIDELGLLSVKPGPMALRRYRETVAHLINELALAGNLLVVGRGGQIVLAARPGVLHVRVMAPLAQRIGRIQAECQVTAEVAAALVEASDHARSVHLQRHYHVHWDAPELYDIVLNMAHLTIPTAAKIVCIAAQEVERSQTEVSV